MNSTIDFCKLPRKNANDNGEFNWYKRPKLWELHKKLFNEYFIGAHDAMTDVEATLRCTIELNKNWLIPFQEAKHEILTLF
jgi:DNA polymerase-3 subunit alpha